ncbi:MAG: L,D-transpeptidase [Prevotellaceae bacterium]|jgi:hypothetical protein|nr:L,D-transpeptidase [Prevotellaceae bacterium]
MNKLTRKNILFLMCIFTLLACHSKNNENLKTAEHQLAAIELPKREIEPERNKKVEVIIEKDFLYTKDSLPDNYMYNKKTPREFQWEKIRQSLASLDSMQQGTNSWAILQNYKYIHGTPKTVKNFHRNDYDEICDSMGTRRYHSTPLYMLNDSITPVLYGGDGILVKVTGHEGNYIKVKPVYSAYSGREWMAPRKFVKILNDGVVFNKVIFVDRVNQNIATLEKVGSKWLVRSQVKATTGMHRAPYDYVTPLGIFLIQEKKYKMLYTVDGSSELAGYAPYANRFSGGAHIHGVPTNHVDAPMIETSPTLGTIPRSHECVRTVTSHAKFIYDDWGETDQTVVVVFD